MRDKFLIGIQQIHDIKMRHCGYSKPWQLMSVCLEGFAPAGWGVCFDEYAHGIAMTVGVNDRHGIYCRVEE